MGVGECKGTAETASPLQFTGGLGVGNVPFVLHFKTKLLFTVISRDLSSMCREFYNLSVKLAVYT